MTPPPAPKERVVPGLCHEPASSNWDEKFGLIGIAISAVAACGLVYFVGAWLKLF